MTKWIFWQLWVDVAIMILCLPWVLGLVPCFRLLAATLLRLPFLEFRIGKGWLIAKFTLGVTRFELRCNPLETYSDVDDVALDYRVRYFLYTALPGLLAIFTGLGIFYVFLLTDPVVHAKFRPGAVVQWWDPDKDAPLKDDDLVLEADGQPVADGLDLARRFRAWKAGPLPLKIERDGKPLAVSLPPRLPTAKKHAIACRNARSKEPLGPWAMVAATLPLFVDTMHGAFRNTLYRQLPEGVYRESLAGTAMFTGRPQRVVLWLGMWIVLMGILQYIPPPADGGAFWLSLWRLFVHDWLPEALPTTLKAIGWTLAALLMAWFAWCWFGPPSWAALEGLRPLVLNAQWVVDI